MPAFTVRAVYKRTRENKEKMARALEFLSIDLELVQKFFADGDSSAYQALITRGEQIYNGEDEEETAEERLVWEEIIRSMSGGNLGKYLAAQKPLGTTSATNDPVSEMKSVALVAVARHFGESLAGVFHSTGASEIFCTEPFEYINQAGFLSRLDSFMLLERSFFNHISLSVPALGGLTRTELSGIPLNTLNSAVINSEDTDVDSWTDGILTLVEEAKTRGLDLVTIYE